MGARGPARRTPPAATAALIAAACLLALVLVGAAAALVAHLVGMDHDGAYDDPAAIAGGSYTAVGLIQTKVGGGLSGSVKKLSGVYELDVWQAAEETAAELNYTFDVTSGKAKLVLVDPDGTVTTLAECQAGESRQGTLPMTLKPGTSRLKLAAAEAATLSWELQWK